MCEAHTISLKRLHLPIFCDPRAGTPLAIASPAIAIDLPSKASVREDAEASVWVAYNKPEYIQRVAVVDDSVVRGTTARQIVAMIRECGASEFHFLVSSPPVRFPNFYGIDTPKPDELVAAGMSIDETRRHIGADSLAYFSYGGIIGATGLPEGRFSTSCFSGVYPVDISGGIQQETLR